MSVKTCPLAWPASWKRTGREYRSSAHFGKRPEPHQSIKSLSIAEADRVRAPIAAMGVRSDDMVISSNLVLNLNGLRPN